MNSPKTNHHVLLLLICCLLTYSFNTYADETRKNKYTACHENQYPDNMTITAQVLCGDSVILDCEVAVFDSIGECRATHLSQTNNKGLTFLTIQGNEDTGTLAFRVIYTHEGNELDVKVNEEILFAVDKHIGSPSSPMKLHIPSPTGIKNVTQAKAYVQPVKGGILITSEKECQISIYGVSGVSRIVNVCGQRYVPLPQGWYIVNRDKFLVE